MTDFRALCAELLSALESEGYAHWVNGPDEDALCLRARAALAEPEPEGPTDEELDACADEFLDWNYEGICAFARAVLARWGTPNSAETRRSLGEPAAGEVAELVAWLRGANWDRQRQTLATRAADLLERLSPPQPVPVSERLPGPGHCTPQGWCWVLYRGFSTWTLEPPLGRDGQPTGWTHWLPAHALPLPEVSNG